MVYYFKNKEGIFSAVLDEFFYGASYVSALPSELRTSLKIFYNAAVNFYDANIRRMKAYQIPNVAEANLNIDHNAMQFIPEFKERELLALEEEKKVWEEVIRNSIASGELRADIDPKETALLFHTMSMGIFYSGAHEKTFPDAEPLRTCARRALQCHPPLTPSRQPTSKWHTTHNRLSDKPGQTAYFSFIVELFF